MKVNCGIVEDLLPLYADNVCSEQSRQAVEAHLQECGKCRKLMEIAGIVPVIRMEPDRPAADRAVKRGFRKIRLRWWVSILLVIVLIPLAGLGWNQCRGRGIHYTNLYEHTVGNGFMKLLEEGNYEKAYEYLDIGELKREWLDEWFEEEKLVNMEADGLAKFCEYGARVEAMGGIDSYEYIGISLAGSDMDGNAVYRLFFEIRISGETQTFQVDVSNDGIEGFFGGGSFLDDPLAQFSIWKEYLWQDYAGCYYDPGLKEYVYDAQ